jgi:hypothetical protein
MCVRNTGDVDAAVRDLVEYLIACRELTHLVGPLKRDYEFLAQVIELDGAAG